jgi:CheY-like chemotaxis protein
MDGETILLVEDNPDHEALALLCLKRIDVPCRVVVARDGVQALETLFHIRVEDGGDAPGLPRMVLLDLKLPKLDGLQVLQRIRADSRTQRLPVVIFTSSRDEQYLVESYDLGVNSYVLKPVEFTDFSRTVQELGRYWLMLNEPPPQRASRG